MTEAYLFALANLVLSGIVGFIALCRINAMGKDVLFRVQCEYIGYLTASVVSGFQPMWGEWPEWGALATMGAILLGMIASSRAWAGDKPPNSATGPAPLGKF